MSPEIARRVVTLFQQTAAPEKESSPAVVVKVAHATQTLIKTKNKHWNLPRRKSSFRFP